MTIAINIKVNDGVVLATDSASTMVVQDPNGNIGVVNVYDNANKLFNLHKELPIGIITWGAGSIGLESTSTIIKNFRKDLMDNVVVLDKCNYSMEEVAIKFKDFFMNKYNLAFGSWPQKPDIGFVIAGYPSCGNIHEEWMIDVKNGVCYGPEKIRDAISSGVTWNGQPEAITRIIQGYTQQLGQVIATSNLVDTDKIGPLINFIQQNSQSNLVSPAMPIKDAIDLAEFLVDLTEKYVRFSPGAQTVGGPIEIASITAHEGFKWIKRKHYYSKSLND